MFGRANSCNDLRCGICLIGCEVGLGEALEAADWGLGEPDVMGVGCIKKDGLARWGDAH